jgi:hypothetical protein
MRGKYLSKKRLEALAGEILSERDKAILFSLRQCRYLMTGQIQRLHFTDNATPTAALRAANRVLQKLKDYGVVEFLERRVGGVRAGSSSYIWTLTESGVNLLHLNDEGSAPRKRVFEPSLYFVKHILAIAETYIRLAEICRRHKLELVKAELEPECWRDYTENGKSVILKPDMFAVTANGKYEDNWFIEIDMSTESLSKIQEKCRRYAKYRNSGIEQKQRDVFPLVVWLAENVSRKSKLQEYIADCRELSENSKGIFTVILSSEFEPLILGGMEELIKKGGHQ